MEAKKGVIGRVKELLSIEDIDTEDFSGENSAETEKKAVNAPQVLSSDAKTHRNKAYVNGPVIRDAKAVREQNIKYSLFICEPVVYYDCKVIADKLKASEAVIVNYNMMTKKEAGKIFYFVKGCIYALGGISEKISDNIFLYTPKTIAVQAAREQRDSSDDTLKFSWKDSSGDPPAETLRSLSAPRH